MAWDSVWDGVFRENEWGKYPDENLIRFVAGKYYAVPDRKKIRFVEVGCGPGANLWYLAREGFDAHGIDGSSEAINIAKRRLTAEHLNVELNVGDVMTLPYPDNYFNCVVDIECLYANSKNDTIKILQEIYRVMKIGGYLFSKSITDKMYLGKEQKEVGRMEFNNISDGPVAGKGFARLMSYDDIHDLYGQLFTIETVDLHEHTRNNQTILNSEWVIVGSKK